MGDPAGFSVRMQGLALVPEPLWWLLGAIVSFYFGARELHYQRARKTVVVTPPLPATQAAIGVPARAKAEATASRPTASATAPRAQPARVPFVAARAAAPAVSASPAPVAVKAGDPHFNAALEEWRRLRD
jgi:hypothetical protein